jgi:hypothetical protein
VKLHAQMSARYGMPGTTGARCCLVRKHKGRSASVVRSMYVCILQCHVRLVVIQRVYLSSYSLSLN